MGRFLIGWVAGSLVFALGCSSDGVGDISLVATVYDAPPDVVFSDPLGPDVHRLGGARIRAYDLKDMPEGTALEDRLLGATIAGNQSGDFVLSSPDFKTGQLIALVVDDDKHAETVFVGHLPEVSEDFPFFVFFDGALFSEPLTVLQERVLTLSDGDTDWVPNGEIPENGALIYGQLLGDPALGDSEPLSGFSLEFEGGEAPFETVGSAHYLDEALAVDLDLTATSESGIFYLAGVPEGLVTVQVASPEGQLLSPTTLLTIEDGFTWCAAFYLPGYSNAEAAPQRR